MADSPTDDVGGDVNYSTAVTVLAIGAVGLAYVGWALTLTAPRAVGTLKRLVGVHLVWMTLAFGVGYAGVLGGRVAWSHAERYL